MPTRHPCTGMHHAVLWTHAVAAIMAIAISIDSEARFINSPAAYVQEFVNDRTGRRFLTSDAAEIKILLSGQVGDGWRRTGVTFWRYTYSVGTPRPVCRFYAPSVNSHFYTVRDFECQLLRSNPQLGWHYEGNEFSALDPQDGYCPVAVRRYYRAPMHRYTADPNVQTRLVRDGWADEGVDFCMEGIDHAPVASYELLSQDVLPTSECEDESTRLGACVALNQLPRFSYRFDGSIPSISTTPGASGLPVPPPAAYFAQSYTGVFGHIVSPIGGPFPEEVLRHSFVQVPPVAGASSSGFGIYVNGRDFVPNPEFPEVNALSINPIYQFPTAAPRAGESDRRVMPWSTNAERRVRLQFELGVAYVRRHVQTDHAISHPVIELYDTRSRQNLYITIGAAQTVPVAMREEEDHFAFDVGTGKVIVSTMFRDNPAFGKTSGQSFYCEANATSHRCESPVSKWFSIDLSRADIAYVIAKARRLNPALSPNVADYAIDNFSFNNEIGAGSELGLNLSNFSLAVFDDD